VTRGLGATTSANTPLPFPTPVKPTNGHHGVNGGNGHGVPMPAAVSTPETYTMVPLAALSERWPEALRLEIAQLNLSQAQLALPSSMIEPALKQGKIVFSWKMLRSWIRPAPLPTVSAHDGSMLELPLAVVAPLFFGRKAQGGTTRRKVQVDENIPNLFFGFPQPDAPATPFPEPAAPIVPAKQAQAPQEPEDLLTPIPFSKGTPAPETNFYVWGDTADIPKVDESEFKRPAAGTDFLSRYATPNEVVTRAVALEGVAGALVALPDGLMVASKLPADVNGDTLAAFLPQIFGKVSQCTKELRMGELNNLNFTVGNVPWKIFRVNAIFFAAFGRAGQGLPTAQLAALAGELNRKKQ
jgi:predicted regulator of Ras-like GTPase activity (Roadblock/LC7/MglB family)